MASNEKRTDVAAAADDLRRRTLSHAVEPLDRLIYVASMRDYNTGLYIHEGLAARFSPEAACEALADCHRESFRDLMALDLRGLTAQLEDYMRASGTSSTDFVRAWKDLEPYRVAIPVGTDSILAEFLFSNLKLALSILEYQHSRAALPPPTA